MLQAFPRDKFLRILILTSGTFDQRTSLGQSALALGVQRPAHAGEYLVLDAIAMLMTDMLHGHGKLELNPAADAVRTHWRDWLSLVTKAERSPTPELFFTVVTMVDTTYRVVVGDKHECVEALGRLDQPFYNFRNFGPLSIHLVLQTLRANARRAKVVLPERFTVAEGEPGYDAWWADIDAYQKRAEARFKAKAKARGKSKGQRPARAPARKRLLTT